MENNRFFDGAQITDAVIVDEVPKRSPFILGNTVETDLQKLQENYLVPVFSRDNVETISHFDFVNTVCDAAQTYFQGEQFTEPSIRVSHEMKLRTLMGRNKLVENLDPKKDCGSYMQRMMFMIEFPNIKYMVNGCELHLQICGVRSYHETNLLGNSTQKQLFRVGIGYLNSVCTNQCLSTSGCKLDIKVTNTADLFKYCIELFSRYDYKEHIEQLKRLADVEIDLRTWAQFLGKAKLYQAIPQKLKNELHLPELILNESQLNSACRDFYNDENFSTKGGNIDGWMAYNLLTNFKNNYIDTSMERSINAFECINGICASIAGEDDTWNWFIE